MGDLRILVDRFCIDHRLSFVQKKLLFLMISQGISRCTKQKSVRFTWEEAIVHAPKLLSFFCAQYDDAQSCQHHAQLRYDTIQQTSAPISLQDIAQHCSSFLPSLFPNRQLLSLFLASSLCKIIDTKTTPVHISKQQWCDTALALMFELEAST